MNEKERQLEHEKAEHQLDESAARLDAVEARARRSDAAGAIAEVSGLRGLQQQVVGQFQAWKQADEASFADLRDAVHRGVASLSRGTDAAADRLDRLDDANDQWLDAETDHIGAELDTFEAWLGEEWVADKQVAAGARSDLQAAWQDTKEKQAALASAATDKKAEARRALGDSLGRLKAKLEAIAERLRGQREEERPGG